MLKILGFFVISATCFIVSAEFRDDDCVRPCSHIHLPVCASNGKSYPNKCTLDIATCQDSSIQFVRRGKCSDDLNNICDTSRYCPLLILDPVCGTDNTTYSNDCYFRKAVCKDPGLKIAHKGHCIKRNTVENTLYEFVKFNIGGHGGHGHGGHKR